MNKKIALYGTITTLAISQLTGCGLKKKVVEDKGYTDNEAYQEENNKNIKQGDRKKFLPGEHLFFIRTVNAGRIGEKKSEDISGGSVNIPDGYEVFEIENFIERHGEGSQTAGYDVWYINTKTVEVSAIYNESIKEYDYSHFGSVIEEDVKTTPKTYTK